MTRSQKRSFSCFTFGKNYHCSFILPRFSVLVALALSSKLVYIGTANFNDIHNLLMRFISFFFSFFAYLPTLSQHSICPRNMKLIWCGLTCWLLLSGCTGRCFVWWLTNGQLIHHQIQLFSWRSGRRWLYFLGTTGSRDRWTVQSEQSFAELFIIMNLPLLQNWLH